MILAAGIGSRLQPLTDSCPKALLKFRGKTMLEHVIAQLGAHGFKEIIINLHHHADQIRDFVKQNDGFGLDINFSDESGMLMDTGGGIMQARWFLQSGGPFLVHNIDIFSDIDLTELYQFHLERKPLATLAVKDRPTSRNLLINKEGLLCGWKNNQTGKTILVNAKSEIRQLAFSGIHIIDPHIFDLLPVDEPFSMTDAYLELAEDHRVLVFDHSEGSWIDMAHPDNFPQLH